MSEPTPWDQRFAGPEYFYGTRPNDFLAAHVGELEGPVLSLAEGEGRNAVFLAEQGLEVLGVDSSVVGLTKARTLAAERGVRVGVIQADLAHFEPEEDHFGAVVSIFAHFPPAVRAVLYPRVLRALRPGGLLLMEGYAERQLGRGTGGPPVLEMLMTVDKVRAELPGLEPLLLHEIERDVIEGRGHTGTASVVQFIGRKPAARPAP